VLIAIIDDPKADRDHLRAIRLLGRIGIASGPKAKFRLVDLVRDERRAIADRRAAVVSLGRYGSQAASALPMLDALVRTEPQLADVAQAAMNRIKGPTGPIDKRAIQLVSAFSARAEDSESDLRTKLDQKGITFHPPTDAPVLAAMLQEPALARIHADVCAILGDFGTAGAPAAAALTALAGRGDADRRDAAVAALGRTGGGPAALRAVVNAALAGSGPAADALLRRGPTALANARPLLRQGLAADELSVRRTAARLLTRYGPPDPAALPVLQASLADGDPEVRAEGLLGMTLLGPASSAGVPPQPRTGRRGARAPGVGGAGRGRPRAGAEAEPAAARVEDLAVGEPLGRPDREVGDVDHRRDHLADRLGVRGGLQPEVHRPAFVGLEMAEADPPDARRVDHARDRFAERREAGPESCREQQRLLVADQEVVELQTDVGSVLAEAEDVRGDLGDGGFSKAEHEGPSCLVGGGAVNRVIPPHAPGSDEILGAPAAPAPRR
jgi:hypothetical protein